ncbi:hypothetical protein HOY82DRAFT_673649 [Tuber indicum]|nr:hypothetical protein HOY82DRAFT_673649 [Tuber indicum]
MLDGDLFGMMAHPHVRSTLGRRSGNPDPNTQIASSATTCDKISDITPLIMRRFRGKAYPRPYAYPQSELTLGPEGSLSSAGLWTDNTFVGAFVGPTKTPDLCYSTRVNGATEFPTIVLEAWWSDSQAQLECDCQLCHEGSASAVKVVPVIPSGQSARPSVRPDLKKF